MRLARRPRTRAGRRPRRPRPERAGWGAHRDGRGPARRLPGERHRRRARARPGRGRRGDRVRPRRPPARRRAHPAPPHPAAGRAHLARPAAPTCPAGADLDRAAPLGLGAGRRHLVRHVPQRGCRGRLGRDRPARARPRRRGRLLEHRAGPRPGAHRPGRRQRHHRRAGRAHRAGRQRAARADASEAAAATRSVRRPQRCGERSAAEGAAAMQRHPPARRPRRPGAGAGSPTVRAAARASGLAPRPPRDAEATRKAATREGAAAVRAVRPAHRRPRSTPTTTSRPTPTDRAPSSRRWSAPATAGAASPGAAWQPASATSTTCGPGRPGPPRPTTCSPSADGTTASSSDPAGGCAWHPTAPRPGPTPPAAIARPRPSTPWRRCCCRSDPVETAASGATDDRPRRPADIHDPPRQLRGALSRPCSRFGWSTTATSVSHQRESPPVHLGRRTSATVSPGTGPGHRCPTSRPSDRRGSDRHDASCPEPALRAFATNLSARRPPP